jgi:hypothetical protein
MESNLWAPSALIRLESGLYVQKVLRLRNIVFSGQMNEKKNWVCFYENDGKLVDKMAFGQVFSEYYGFPCQFSSYQLLHIH